MHEQVLIFVAFLLAFAVKVPMWPVHTWLPDAHVEAPTGGSVILAAIMLKMGGYGFLRFSLPIAPDASRELDWLIISLSLIAVGLHRFRRAGAAGHEEADRVFVDRAHGLRDARLVPAFADRCARPAGSPGAAMGLDGAMVQMISHGLISGALFFCIGVLYDRVHSRADRATTAASSTRCRSSRRSWCCSRMANAGLPGTSGLRRRVPGDPRRASSASFWYAFLAGDDADPRRGLHAVAGQERVIFGPVANEHVAALEGPDAAGISGARSAGGRRARTRHCSGAAARCNAPDDRATLVQHDGDGRSHEPASIRLRFICARGAEIVLLGATCVILLIDLFLDDKNSLGISVRACWRFSRGRLPG